MLDAGDPRTPARMAEVRQRVQSPFLEASFANLLHENGDAGAARAILERLPDWPHERGMLQGFHLGAMRASRDLGEDDAALRHAQAAGRAGRQWAERIERHLAAIRAGDPAAAAARRVVLGVPFVRQDHLTCSPATMASLLEFFGVHVAQREIAEKITYDGTPSHRELEWAADRGLVARFFQFDPAIARALLDRGLPFALSTRFEQSGHRQAVTGYDAVLDTFQLRDPTGNFRREVDAKHLTELAARGGDCALLLPEEIASRVAALALPLEDETMAVQRVRIDVDRRVAGAVDRAAELLATLPPGPLRFDLDGLVARERGDRKRQLDLYREVYEQHPEDSFWQFHYAAELLDQGRWQDARALLERWTVKGRAPYLRTMLADQLRHHAGRRAEAEALLRRALRSLPREARTWHRLGHMLWDDPARREEATELYRLAAALSPHDEAMAWSHFAALRELGREEPGLAFLRERHERYGARSPAPAATLADALETLHRPDEAILVLAAAVRQNDDPNARVRLFDLLLRHRRFAEAEELLADAARFQAIDHALARHRLARARGRHDEAVQALESVVAIDPWHADAQVQRIENELERNGTAAAIQAADRVVAAHGEDPRLCVRIAEFFQRIEDRNRAEALLRRLVDEHPHEYWLQGRLARHLLIVGKPADAAPLLERLTAASPHRAPVWSDVAELHRQSGRIDEARAAARRAVELDPEDLGSLRRLLDWAPDAASAADEMRSVMRLLAERPVPPAAETMRGLTSLADGVPDEEFAAFLARLQQEFAAAPAPAVARCRFLLEDEPEQALAIAEDLVERMPWVDDHWLLQALCLRQCNRRADERELLEQLLQRDPGCAQAYVEIGESYEQEGRWAEAIAVLERGLVQAPGYAVLHGMLADARWRLGDRDRALASVARAGELDRGYGWAFQARVLWLCELDRHEEALAVADELVATNPRWGVAHELHARVLELLGRHEEKLDALRRWLALTPRLGDARRRLVEALIELRRFDEARSALAEGRDLLGDDPELMLLEAQIDRVAGELAAAREKLQEGLRRHPDFLRGWALLLQWLDEEGLDEELLRLHREPPEALAESVTLLGYAADVMRRRNDLAGAQRALERALQIDAGYDWARDTLCSVLLDRDRPAEVLRWIPDHERPESLPLFRAALVARAAARSDRHELATGCLLRVLRDPGVQGPLLGTVERDLHAASPRRVRRQREAVLRAAVEAASPQDPLFENWLRVLAARGDAKAVAAGIARIHAAWPKDRADVAAARVLADASRTLGHRTIAPIVAAHVVPPLRDTDAWARFVFALSGDREGSEQAIRITGADWRRQDVEGWMLANLAEAFFDLGRYDEMEQVSRHALDHVPHDHSVWWHRRFLAEAAYARGDLERSRDLCRMPIVEFPSVRLSVAVLDLLCELRQAPWWRRPGIARRRRKEIGARWVAARKERPPARWRTLRLPEVLRHVLWPW